MRKETVLRGDGNSSQCRMEPEPDEPEQDEKHACNGDRRGMSQYEMSKLK